MPRKTNKRHIRGKKTRKQRIIKMVGCNKNHKSHTCTKCGTNNYYLNRKIKGGSGCGSCGCPIPPLSWNKMNQFGGEFKNVMNGGPILGIGQNGGSCGACQNFKGGNSFYKPPAPIPGPFVGEPWGTNSNNWPGSNGISNDNNYLSKYSDVINNDPALKMQLDATKIGGRRRKHSYKYKGGGFFPQDLTNLGRDFSFNIQSAYNSLNGYNAPANPLPYKGQLTNSIAASRIII